MKKTLFAIGIIFLSFGASAQNGVYQVTNQSQLTESLLEQRLRSSKFELTIEDNNENRGMKPMELDSAEMIAMLEYFFLEENPDVGRMIAGAIPAQVTVDGQAVTLTDDRGDTIQTYVVKEIRGSEAKREFVCADGSVIKLVGVGNDLYTLQVPKMEKIKVKKTM